jgi:hypothetical protein
MEGDVDIKEAKTESFEEVQGPVIESSSGSEEGKEDPPQNPPRPPSPSDTESNPESRRL